MILDFIRMTPKNKIFNDKQKAQKTVKNQNKQVGGAKNYLYERKIRPHQINI